MLITSLLFIALIQIHVSLVSYLSEVKEEETCIGIALALKMWQDLDMSVTPKLYVLENHLYSQLSLFQGLGD
jgi:hypothetical protein